jgi:hypothetical protein
MFKYQLTTAQWLELSPVIRSKFADRFDLKRSAGTMIHYSDGKANIISDGYTHGDLAKVTVETMQTLLGTTEINFWKLLEDTVALFEKEVLNEAQAIVDKANQEATSLDEETEMALEEIQSTLKELASHEAKKKRGRPKKEAAVEIL